MKRWMLWMILGLTLVVVQAIAPAAPAAAQGGGCEVDLADIIAALEAAQQRADDGNPFTAVLEIEVVLAQLEQAVANCDDLVVPLTGSYTSPDELVSFAYPEDWFVLSPESGVYALANSQTALDMALENDLPEVTPGDQIILLVIGPVEETFGGVTDFESFVVALQEEGLGPDTSLIGPISTRPIGRYPARLFRMSGETSDGLGVAQFSQGCAGWQ
jgi:hypothetical protein